MARQSAEFAELVKGAIGGRSVRNAARLAHTSHTSLLNWLMGDIPIDPDAIRVFARSLKVPVTPLLRAAGYSPSPEEITEDLDLYDLLPPEEPNGVDAGIPGRALANLLLHLSNQGLDFNQIVEYLNTLRFYPVDLAPAPIRDRLKAEGGEVYVTEQDLD